MFLLQAAIAFIFAIGLLVFVHEFGHYLVARLCNVKVLRFSLGVGKVLYSKCLGKDKTEWALSLLPIGGYVMMLDAREQDLNDLSEEDLKREFNSQNVWKRIAIVLAGAMANFLLGIAILTGVNMYGIKAPTTKLRAVQENSIAWHAGLRGGEHIVSVNGVPVRVWSGMRWEIVQTIIDGDAIQLGVSEALLTSENRQPDRIATISQATVKQMEFKRHFTHRLGLEMARPPAVLQKVLPNGPADLAGLKAGDQVLSVGGKKLVDALEFVQLVHQSPGKNLELTVLRDGRQRDVSVMPVVEIKDGKQTGRLMADVSVQPEMTVAKEPLFGAMAKAVAKTYGTISVSLKMIGKMIVGDVSLTSLSGPIAIADFAGQSARLGVIKYLSFISFISISIGVINLLPIPVLDGGLLLYYSMELLTGRRVSERAGKIAQRVGMAMMLLLMVVATFNDIVRLVF